VLRGFSPLLVTFSVNKVYNWFWKSVRGINERNFTVNLILFSKSLILVALVLNQQTNKHPLLLLQWWQRELLHSKQTNKLSSWMHARIAVCGGYRLGGIVDRLKVNFHSSNPPNRPAPYTINTYIHPNHLFCYSIPHHLKCLFLSLSYIENIVVRSLTDICLSFVFSFWTASPNALRLSSVE